MALNLEFEPVEKVTRYKEVFVLPLNGKIEKTKKILH
jgi:hypothetical protein